MGPSPPPREKKMLSGCFDLPKVNEAVGIDCYKRQGTSFRMIQLEYS